MVAVAVLSVLLAGLTYAGMSFMNMYLFAKSHNWHYAVKAGLYALGAVFFIGWIFVMSR